MRTYDNLKRTVNKHNLLWAENELFGNYIWERTNDIITNKFDDWLHIAWKEKGINYVVSIPATTKAGIKGAVDAPPTVEGVTGTAIIVFPQQAVNTWKYMNQSQCNALGKHYPFSHPFFQQIKPLKYWRDNLTEEVKSGAVLEIKDENHQQGIYGTNWHVMSNPPPANQSGNVNNWSEGCMGAQYSYWERVIDFAEKSTAEWGDEVSGILLRTEDFEE
jgi:hypothetical protein